ncbi:Dimethyladenosine transferase [Elusimicrobium minutum Pei191]|uniref:Dimethyladenosine transferase n=1 Tax=Elusimicrobium minutum (strain Pei191) TaxID=445932 RepID=B2KCK9_ELUMP|nr:16S rRNA (adenine(1518)-N(6)/adenine(1519)-N(6))-dimethyltransferase RsmA [Elusimicrobium minutum]ACC98255.1 Dimethyladenosine transferase [Elusimicrobium minutum Pei191]
MQKYGQHFLVNEGVIDKIVNAVVDARARHPKARIIEIGPGKGALTLRLLDKGIKDLKLIEIDPIMVDHLRGVLPSGVEIIQSDFLDTDLSLLSENGVIFVSNLPYINAAEILNKVLNYKNFLSAVFMFQREQAQRIKAGEGDTFYSPISLTSQIAADIKSLCRVSPGSFNPPPKVESEVLCFERNIKIQEDLLNGFTLAVQAAFAYKRKNVLNSISEYFKKDKKEIFSLLESSKISPNCRAQNLTQTDYKVLAGNIKKMLN